MNSSAELFDWILHTPNNAFHNGHGSCEIPCKVELSELSYPSSVSPGLVFCSDSDSSSFIEEYETVSMCSTTSSSTDCCSSSTMKQTNVKQKVPLCRRVSFESRVEIREYSITVGDHPLCMDGLPLTLDWGYNTAEQKFRDIDSSRSRTSRYKAPKRLSFDERRNRLFHTTTSSATRSHDNEGASPNEQRSERSMELSMIIKMLHNSCTMNSILPPPRLYDIDEEEEADELEAAAKRRRRRRRQQQRRRQKLQQQSEQVIEWKRVLHGSTAVME